MSRNPYHIDGQEPSTLQSVFVFMDMLGYKEMIRQVQESSNQQEVLCKLYCALKKGREWLDGEVYKKLSFSKKDSYALKAFTDHIVIGWPFNRDTDGWQQFNHLCFTLAWFQFELIIQGFFIRGAVSVGDAYVDEIVVFGNALTEAVEDESSLARDPRIILSKSAVEAVKKYLDYGHSRSSSVKKDILIDSDGQYFLNYLYYVFFAGDNGNYKALQEHKRAIEEKLNDYKGKPMIWSKYAWVAGYHNYFCDSNLSDLSGEYKINVHLFQASPALVMDNK